MNTFKTEWTVSYFPQVCSLLIDEATLQAHLPLCTEEMDNNRFTGELAGLTPDESSVFAALKDNTFGKSLRLEQERIGYAWLLDPLV
ncbi:Wadjet anti-phage system protein JetD domain-containing protein [Endozoicomonas acroporae]|uniref:Wadjet anti-phage system protein JetD domain-containing protein n=1 Tax=Endozoicomonas acroporae TaxID=1701104 RepID=UPI0019D574B4|nr:Wadjet anti-phage system protein JetD domain-containing protein [Endozoicomonas acroporae]